jgi:hypothetical protein
MSGSGTFEICRRGLERPVTGVDRKWLAHGQDDAIDPFSDMSVVMRSTVLLC